MGACRWWMERAILMLWTRRHQVPRLLSSSTTPRFVISHHITVYATNNTQSDVNAIVEDCMRDVAKRNDTVRFVKLHAEDAEMDPDVLPAVLAYKGGDKFASLLPLLDELPDDSELSAVALETVFRQ
jgi:hypothetical protein